MSRGALVKSEMTAKAVCVKPEDHLYHAFAVMRRLECRHLPVVDDGEVVGMLSDRDLFRRSTVRNGELVVGSLHVRDVMTKGVWTCRATDRLGDVADEMLRRKIDALPVVDDLGKLRGIITSTDLLEHLRRVEQVLDVGAAMANRVERTDDAADAQDGLPNI